MLTSPLANLHQQLILKLQSLGLLSYISQDLGQLEHYNIRPAVSYPCALIDIDEMNFSDIQNDKTQIGEGFVQIRLGLIKYTDASNLTPAQYQEAALKFYEVEQAIHVLLHGWAPPVDGFERLLRRAAITEARQDDVHVRLLRYQVVYKDISTKPVRTTISVKDPVINGNVNQSIGVGFDVIENDLNVYPE